MPFGLSVPDLGDVADAAGGASSAFRRSVKSIKRPVSRSAEDVASGITTRAQSVAASAKTRGSRSARQAGSDFGDTMSAISKSRAFRLAGLEVLSPIAIRKKLNSKEQ